MSRQIESVAVLGCGTMGSGIAAASAAAGCRVLMLDVTLEAALRGLEAVDEADRSRVLTGTFDNDLALISEYDWVCEAIVEDLASKQQLFANIEPLRKDGSVVSSNTSGIPLRDIAKGMSERFCSDVAITHFFNPVRVMKLFELVPGEQTSSGVIEAFAKFGAERLNKGVVHAKDTVNFIGNRIGCYFMLSGLQLAKPFLAAGMTQETVNAILGKPMGLPPTGLYGLIDLIGLDVMDLVGKNLAINLPEGDAGRSFTAFPSAEQRMLDRGQLGRKARDLGGFSRVQKLADGTKRSETFDLQTEQWREAIAPNLENIAVADLAKPGVLMFSDSEAGRLAWQIFGGTLRYAAGLVPEIADDVVNIDNAIRWGFNWIHGPFELLDAVGPERVIARILSEGAELPAMLQVLADSGSPSFYRTNGDAQREYLGRDGSWHPVSSVAA
jgi:3-hydroxyacyl-CoA dehydrogenase